MTDGPLPEQEAFIMREPVGHALLVAGPGTGKTYTLEGRSRFVVEQANVPEDSIAVLTLTRAMVRSLVDRMPYGRVQTFHAFALAHLNRVGAAWNRKVVDPWEEKNIVVRDIELGAEHAFAVGVTPTEVRKFLKRMASAFRKSQTEPPDISEGEARLLQVFEQHRRLFRYCLMDELAFDLVQLLEQGIDLPAPPSLVLADEYQDFTAGELRLLLTLSDRYGTMVEAAGDDRQSIYGFRAADPLALHRFPHAYGLQAVDYLHRSKRCPRRICELVEVVAEGLPALEGLERPPLGPWPEREDEGEINIVTAPGLVTEARWITRQCLELVESGVRPCDIMVIASSFYDIVFAQLQAEREGIQTPFDFYNPRGSDPRAGDVGVRLLAAGSRLLMNRTDQMAWRTLVWATPHLGEQRLTNLLVEGGPDYTSNLAAIAERDATTRRPHEAGLAAIAEYEGADAVPAVTLVELLAARIGRPDLNQDAVRALVGDGDEARRPVEWLQAVFEISLSITISPEERPDDIPVRTIFGAKGLESRVVFLSTAIPQSFVRGNPADELRKLYVGLTRATESLYISAPRWIGGTQLEYATGDRVGGLVQNVVLAAQRLGIPLQEHG